MPAILTDLSAPALAAATRANLYDFFLCGERAPVMELARRDGFVRWFLPHPLAWFHGALSSRDAAPGDGDALDETLAYFKDKNAGEVCWWLQDNVSAAGWEELLAARGFTSVEGPPGMAVDLAALPAHVILPPGAEIHKVEDAADMRTFTELLSAVFGFPPESVDVICEWEVAVGLGLPSTCYLATLDGVPVGTSQVLHGAGVPGVYNVAVTEEARGKGLGAALTLQPLLEARAMGYRAGVLQSSESGYSLYRRLGFEQHCRLDFSYLKLE